MDRIVGIETEYGCLVGSDDPHANGEAWPVRVRNHLFRKAHAGTIDLHYRDYEEPPGNGGFLLNGGRLYLDMGHIEYVSPECLHLRDIVTYDLAGDDLLQSALESLGIADRVSFIKNNIDHQTGATFGCHENYLVRRTAPLSENNVLALLAFLTLRLLFAGSGRVGSTPGAELRGDLPITGQIATEDLDVERSRQAEVDRLGDDIRRQKIKSDSGKLAIEREA